MEHSTDEDALDFFNRLLERLHQADQTGRIELIYVASGAQHIDTIQTQNVYHAKRQEAPQSTIPNDYTADDTPLSALFRESHHDELRKIIESWRPALINDDPSVDALKTSSFQFDFDKIIATSIYIDLGRLLNEHALVDNNMGLLASYLYQHSNLSNSQPTLYAQLRKYKKR